MYAAQRRVIITWHNEEVRGGLIQKSIMSDDGLKMLEKWEKESTSLLLGEEKSNLLLEAEDDSNVLDLNAPVAEKVRDTSHRNQYDSFFE